MANMLLPESGLVEYTPTKEMELFRGTWSSRSLSQVRANMKGEDNNRLLP